MHIITKKCIKNNIIQNNNIKLNPSCAKTCLISKREIAKEKKTMKIKLKVNNKNNCVLSV